MTGDADDRLIFIARIGAAHGVKGEVRVKSFTEDPLDLDAYGPLVTRDGARRFTLRAIKGDGMLVVAFDGVADRTNAEKLNGTDLYVPRSALPETDEDDFYYEDLVGLQALTPEGEAIGRVTGVFDFGAGDLLEIAPENAKSFLVAFTRETVPAIDLASRRLTLIRPAETGDDAGDGAGHGDGADEDPA